MILHAAVEVITQTGVNLIDLILLIGIRIAIEVESPAGHIPTKVATLNEDSGGEQTVGISACVALVEGAVKQAHEETTGVGIKPVGTVATGRRCIVYSVRPVPCFVFSFSRRVGIPHSCQGDGAGNAGQGGAGLMQG